MPTITQGKELYLGVKRERHKYITVELENTSDMIAISPNFVPSCDWFSWDNSTQINGRMLRIDISQQIQAAGIDALQSVYIDNGPNNCSVTIEVPTTKQRVTCPPNSQGWFPLICAAKDGRLTISYVDKDDNSGGYGSSWLDIAGVNGSQIPVKYKPTFHFTDLAVPPAVWDCRQRHGVLYNFGHQFVGAATEQLTNGQGTRRLGIRWKALETNFAPVDLKVFNTFTGAVSSAIWRLEPGEAIAWEGDSCPTNIFYGQAAFAGEIILGFIMT